MADSQINQLIDSVKNLDLAKTKKTPSTPKRKQQEPWTKSNLKTGLIFDDFMTSHECLWTYSDENPLRYKCVRESFEKYNLIEQCHVLNSVKATKEDVLLSHDEAYYELVKSTKGERDLDKLKAISEKFDGIYFHPDTYDVAMLALGCCLALTDAVVDNSKIKNGFALIRTPGHHAQRSEANGFCFFNNAAISAKHCIQKRGMKKVLIIDWDVHHGQGTQSLFYDDPNVLYVSIHRYEKGKYWPELIESNFNFTGQGAGKGYNFNFPLNETGCNDIDFLLMWFNVIMPVAYEFNPELVIISAGYDAAIGCPEGKMRVKPITYHILCHSLMSLADGKVVALLEGGYFPPTLAHGAINTLRALLGYPMPKIDQRVIEFQPHASVIHTILDVIWATRPQWRMLRLQGSFERFKPDLGDSRGGDVDQRGKYCPIATYEGTASYTTKPEKYDLEGVSCPKDPEREATIRLEVAPIIERTDLSVPPVTFGKRTLLMLDDEMLLHECSEDHPEKPARYASIKKRLEETGIFDRCTIGKSRKATEEEIATVHDKNLIKLLKNSQNMTIKELDKLTASMDSIYLNQASYQCALLAAGCAIEAVDQVMKGDCLNAFALIRPPGHHANRETSSGFCFFNNVVVAARYAQEHYSEKCKRILIVDYDFHHGNGVQDLVQDDENILYISLHGYNDAREYPFELKSNYTTGSKNIINIPWNDDKMGDPEYVLAYLTIVLPCAYEFNPDLVFVSSGFDAGINDPLGRYKVSPAAYGHMIHHLLPLASGRLVACLEGGYNLQTISESAANVVSVLQGNPPPSLNFKRPPSDAAILSIKNVISYHKSNYKSLCLDFDLPSDQVE